MAMFRKIKNKKSYIVIEFSFLLLNLISLISKTDALDEQTFRCEFKPFQRILWDLRVVKHSNRNKTKERLEKGHFYLESVRDN